MNSSLRNTVLSKSKLIDPTHIQGCQLWLDASNAGGVKSGNAAQFAVANLESLSIADASQTGLDPGTSDFALAGWAYFDTDFAAIRSLVGKGSIADSGGSAEGYWIYISTNGKLGTRFGEDGATTRIVVNGNTVLSVATWYFITVNFDRDGNLTIRVNDTADNAGAISAQPGSVDTTQAFRLGSKSNDASHMNGRQQNWIMLNRLITAAELTWLYNGGVGREFKDFGQAGTDGSNLTVAGGIVSGWKLGEQSGQRSDYFAANHLTDNNTVTQNDGVALVEAVDGDNVRQATDLSGNAKHAIRTGNVTSKPTHQTGEVNGKPVIRSDGSNDSLLISQALGIAAGTAHTIVAVLKVNSGGSGDDIFFEQGNYGAGAYSPIMFYRYSDGKLYYGHRNTTQISAAQAQDVFFIVVGTYAGGTGALNLYLNGVLSAGPTNSAIAGDSLDNLTGILSTHLGANTLLGDLPKLVVYNRVLNAGELSRLTRALGRKSAIAVT